MVTAAETSRTQGLLAVATSRLHELAILVVHQLTQVDSTVRSGRDVRRAF